MPHFMREAHLGFGWVFWGLVTLSAASGVAIVFLIEMHVRETQAASALQHARDMSRALSIVRATYARDVIGRIVHNNNITVTHDFRGRKDAIPLPATLSIELADELSRSNGGTRYRLLSSYPFPWRADRNVRPIEKAALDRLGQSTEGSFDLRSKLSGQQTIIFAQPVKMTESCVQCHNAHPQSPKQDWRVGDVRGLQLVEVPLKPLSLMGDPGIVRIIIFLTVAFIAAISLIWFLIRRTQKEILATRNAESQARKAEARLIEAIEALPDGFVLFDTDDRLLVCNDRYKKVYETSADLIQPGATFESIIRGGAYRGQYRAASDREAWITARMEAHRNPGESLEQKLDDGRWLRIIERRTESGFTVGFRVDITELKEREEALRRSQGLKAAMFRAALDPIVVIDSAGRFIHFNPAAERVFGYRAESVMGREMADLIIPQRYRAAHREGMRKFLATGEGPVIGQRIEIEAICSDGTEIIVELAIQHAEGADGPVFIGYLRDITANKEHERALVEAKESAEVATRTKAAFLAMMSHEIRTPLNGVLGILSLLQETELKPQQGELIRTASKSGNALLTILNDILEFSKLEAGHIALEESCFSVPELLNDVAELVRPMAEEKRLTLTAHVSSKIPQACRGDVGRLRQVLLNFGSNAVKFTDHGSIHMEVTRQGSFCSDAAELMFSVEDTGIGIADEQRDLIFSEFASFGPDAGGSSGGTGLGLSICKLIIETMGGDIGVDRHENGGSRFWFTVSLPVAQAQAKVLETISGSRVLPKSLNVLLAEDNSTNRLVITKMLQTLDCRVTAVDDGQAAVEAAASAQYDIALLDVAMPVMDGIAATRQIRELNDQSAQMPIWALTAYAMAEDQARCLAAGMDGVLTKPITRQRLYDTLRNVDAISNERSGSDTNREPIDFAIFDALFEGQSADFRNEALRQFRNDIAAERDRLTSAAQDQLTEDAERATHLLAGLAGTFGATRLGKLASELNASLNQGRRPDLDAMNAVIEEIELVLKLLGRTQSRHAPEVEAVV